MIVIKLIFIHNTQMLPTFERKSERHGLPMTIIKDTRYFAVNNINTG